MKTVKTDAKNSVEWEALSSIISKAKRTLVLTGAGISVSGGIPDFRSNEGLYKMVKDRYPGAVVKGSDLFDAALFKNPATTKLFYTFMSQLKQNIDKATPTRTHEFINDLGTKGKLVRCYTQNIDCLEKRIGMTSDGKNPQVVQLHGDLDTLCCTICTNTQHFTTVLIAKLDEGHTQPCPECETKNSARISAGKRSISVGFLRPNIVLYNEHHKMGNEISELQSIDFKKSPDLLIVMGTSLKIIGVKRLIKDFSQIEKCHVVFMNTTAPPKEFESIFHYYCSGTCDDSVDIIQQWCIKIESSKAEILAKRSKERVAREKRNKAELKGARPITDFLKIVKQESVVSESKKMVDQPCSENGGPINSASSKAMPKQKVMGSGKPLSRSVKSQVSLTV